MNKDNSNNERLSGFSERKKDLLDALTRMIENIEALPPIAIHQPVTHYDMASFMLLIKAILLEG